MSKMLEMKASGQKYVCIHTGKIKLSYIHHLFTRLRTRKLLILVCEYNLGPDYSVNLDLQ